MFSLESPHRGNSNGYTQYTIFNIKEKITLNYHNYHKYAAMGFFFFFFFFCQETQEQVQTIGGKRAISVLATEYHCINIGNTRY